MAKGRRRNREGEENLGGRSPCAGICPEEPFDPTPYADAVARFLLRNPMNQNLPRKFKIAFSGCGRDAGLTPSVLRQKQLGYAAVHLRLLLGEVTPGQLRTLARAARDFGGEVRSTSQQNFILRWIPEDALPELYLLLGGAGLALPGAERLVDVTACPGADTCQSGLTSAHGLALAVGAMIEREVEDLADEAGIRIKISGCPNACGHHHIATIGLFGGARKFDGEQAPTYHLLLGGSAEPGNPRFGKPVARVPAKLVPQAIRAVLEVYRRERRAGQPFNALLERMSPGRLREVLAPWTELAPPAEAPDTYLDWGGDQRFEPEAGPGECAA